MSAWLIISSTPTLFENFLKEELKLDLAINNPDVIRFNDDDGALKIATVRQIGELADFPPYKAKVKTIIVANFEKATIPAQNAFLKLLEEHPPYLNFVLGAKSLGKILPTIKSRCLVKNLTAPTAPTAASDTELTEEFLQIFTGNYGDLITWAEKLKEREVALEKTRALLLALQAKNSQEPSSKLTLILNKLSIALGQLEQNANVLLTLENCLFAIKSRF